MTTVKLTNRWQTIVTLGYSGSVSRIENRAAHGSVCLHQARKRADGMILGRKVNSNGRHEEVGEPFEIDAERVEHWASLDRQCR
jgi:hypothetical protein